MTGTGMTEASLQSVDSNILPGDKTDKQDSVPTKDEQKTEEVKKDTTEQSTPVPEKGSSENDKENKVAEEQKILDDKMQRSIIRQVEYYFGDFNLPKDTFLKEQIALNEEGWVSAETMLKFKRLQNYTSDQSVLINVLSDSSSQIVDVDKDNLKIRRKPGYTIPENNEERKTEMQKRTVYAKGFDKSVNMDFLLDFFDNYESVQNVFMRNYKVNKNQHFKGSVFVTFKDEESAKKFMELEDVKVSEKSQDQLERKWQKDYFAEKEKEFQERKASKQKKSSSKHSDDDDEKSEEAALPKGAVLVIDEIPDDSMREDIKSSLQSDYEVKNEDYAFIDFQKGDTCAKVRFAKENFATELFKKMKEGEFKVKDKVVKFRVMEGEEEETFLKESLKSKSDFLKKKYRGRGNNHQQRGGHKRSHQGGRNRNNKDDTNKKPRTE